MAAVGQWAYPNLESRVNGLTNTESAAIFGYPMVVRHEQNTQPYFGFPTTHRELEDTLHGPWARGRFRSTVIESVIQHLIGIDQRAVFQVYPPRETDSIETTISTTEYMEYEAKINPEHQPAELVGTRGGSWSIRTERYAMAFRCGRLWGRQPGSLQEIQYGINQVKESFLLTGEKLIYREFRKRPELMQAQFILRAEGHNRMDPYEYMNADAALFGALVRKDHPVAELVLEAMHTVRRPQDEFDTVIFPRGAISFLSRKLVAGRTANEIGETAFRDGFDLNTGNNSLVIGRNYVFESRRMDSLLATVNHTEPLAEAAVVSSFWVFHGSKLEVPVLPDGIAADQKEAALADAIEGARAALELKKLERGIYIHDNRTDRLVFISEHAMERNAFHYNNDDGAADQLLKEKIGKVYFIMRPNERRWMSSAIITKRGGAVGYTNIVHQGVEVSHDGDRETSKITVRMHVGPVSLREDLLLRIANVGYVPLGHIGGGGSTIFNHANVRISVEDAIFQEDADGACDIVIFSFPAGTHLPSTHFYPGSNYWGSGGEQQEHYANLQHAIKENFPGIKELPSKHILCPDDRTRDEGRYWAPCSPGFAVIKTNTFEVQQGQGRDGPINLAGFRAAKEMRMSSATSLIADSRRPNKERILEEARH